MNYAVDKRSMEILNRCYQIMLFIFIPINVSMAADALMPDIYNTQTEFAVKLNGTICLPCKVTRQSNEPLKKVLFYWLKDNSTVLNWPRYRIKENRCLRIRNIVGSDAGRYVCNAQNSFGKKSVTRKLIVLDDKGIIKIKATKMPKRQVVTTKIELPPFFRESSEGTKEIVKKSFVIGRKGKLKCTSKGSPPTKITWYKGSQRVKHTHNIAIRDKTFSLVIRNFTKQYEGIYRCIAQNPYGKVNMTFIVSTKIREVRKLPSAQEFTLNVKNGMNLSLTCRSPANQVNLMKWHIPKSVPRLSSGRSVFKDFERSRNLIEPKVENNSRVEILNLYNITEKIHSGIYECLVLYKNSKDPFSLKKVHIKFIKERVVTPSSEDSTLILYVGIPVFAGVLSMVLILIFVRCYKYHKKKSLRLHGQNGTLDPSFKYCDEEDTLSLPILPAHFPSDSLRIHKDDIEMEETELFQPKVLDRLKSTSSLDKQVEKSPSNSIIVSIRDPYVSSEAVNICNSKTRFNTDDVFNSETNNLQEDSISFTQNSLYNSSKENSLEKLNPTQDSIWSRESKWPGEKLEPGDIDYIDFHEEDELLFHPNSNDICTSNIDNERKIHSNGYHNSLEKVHKRKEKNRNKNQEEKFSPDDNLNDSLSHRMLLDDDDEDDELPMLEMSESPEDDDLLLQREMKNWEPLIRDSSRRNDTDECKTNLLPVPRCSEQAHQQDSQSQRERNMHLVI